MCGSLECRQERAGGGGGAGGKKASLRSRSFTGKESKDQRSEHWVPPHLITVEG